MTGQTGSVALDFNHAKSMARSRDPRQRSQVAARTEVPPELLYYLATDATPDVRREVSRNTSTPRQADLLLVRDDDIEVRSGLALKIARVAPDLAKDQLSQLERITLEILETLARDTATEVKEILANELKDSAQAPRSVINILARDLELKVCGPVLRNSPILTEDDLLEIIFGGPPGGALSEIACRKEVSARVSDAIVTSDDVQAVTTLLKNPSAQIQEDTLDRIIDRAPQNTAWHEPLVARPQLPDRAVARLTTFVADSLLMSLRTRTDLSPKAAKQIADSVRQRLNRTPEAATGAASHAAAPAGAGAEATTPAESPADRVKRLKKEGKLDESAVATGIAEGNRAFVLAALADLASTDVANVERVVASHSGRAVTALVWKAGLSMKMAKQVQLRLAQIPPKQALNPRDGQHFPMSDKDMLWQLEFFGIS